MDKAILEIEGLRTHFHMKDGIVRAVDGVDLRLNRGEVLGIVGESGCGKSVMAYSVLNVLPSPGRIVDGSIRYLDANSTPFDLAKLPRDGEQIRKIRGREISMVFQEPMAFFSPVRTIGAQVSETLRLHERISKSEAAGRALEMLKKVGIPRPESVFRDYPHRLSGGMRQRAMIAMALTCHPRILIADEPTTAIDVTLQAQVLRLLRRLQDELQLSIMFITHDLGIIAQMARTVAVMYLGRVVEYGTVQEVFDHPLHPYTADLLESVPTIGARRQGPLAAIAGSVPDPYSTPRGCPFHPRCQFMIPRACDRGAAPAAIRVAQDHLVSCVLHS